MVRINRSKSEKDKMVINLLKKRNRLKDPVMPSSEIISALNHVATGTTISKHLRDMERREVLEFKEVGPMAVYWLSGDFEKRKKKFQMNMGWE
tara:strand:- start:351 stop:629 length:279 start_codon:yes stop_codon:yes gene_type:complete